MGKVNNKKGEINNKVNNKNKVNNNKEKEITTPCAGNAGHAGDAEEAARGSPDGSEEGEGWSLPRHAKDHCGWGGDKNDNNDN